MRIFGLLPGSLRNNMCEKRIKSRYLPENCDNSNKDKVGESYRIQLIYSLNLTKNDGRIDSISQRKGEILC